jgi:hypothetical protein
MKLQRAEEHFGQLDLEHRSFLKRNPYRMLRERDLPAGEGHFVWRAKVVEHPPYEKWASLVGECAHSLRAALEHTAYALVNTQTFVSDKTAFPILDDGAKWQGSHPRDLPRVPQEVLAEVERLQPYNAPKLKADPLWIVNQLDIIDKHRRLNLVNTTLEGTHWEGVHGTLTVKAGPIGAFYDGAVVGRFELVPDPPDPRMQMSTSFEFGIAIAMDEPGEGQSALGLLEDLRAYVGGVVALFGRYF